MILPRLRPKNGFTILETLLAVTLFALVISSAYGVFAGGIQIWKRAQGRLRTERKVVLGLEKMGQEMRTTPQLAPKVTAGLSVKKEFKYGGDSREVTLPAAVSFTGKNGDLLTQYGAVTYRWDSAHKELCRLALSASDLFTGIKPECRVLSGSVERLVFRYWLYSPIGKSYSWYDQWDGEDGLPQAVEVTLEISPQLRGEKTRVKHEFKRLFILQTAGVPADAAP